MIGKSMNGIDSAGNYPRPGAGGYVIKITKASNNMSKERTEFEFDIAEGLFAGYYRELYDRAKFWGGNFSKSFSDKALPFYKGFVEMILESNVDTDGLVIGNYDDIDETKFVGKLIGMAVGEKEYIGNDGVKKTKLDTYNAEFVTVEDLRAGNFKVPDFVPISEQPKPTAGNVVDTTAQDPTEHYSDPEEDCPF